MSRPQDDDCGGPFERFGDARTETLTTWDEPVPPSAKPGFLDAFDDGIGVLFVGARIADERIRLIADWSFASSLVHPLTAPGTAALRERIVSGEPFLVITGGHP